MKRITLIYLAGYLALGGLGLLLAPETAFYLLLSTGDYGDVMPRVVGMFMLALATLIGAFVRRADYTYYRTTIFVRGFIVGVLALLYIRTSDPMFLVLEGIVLLGLLPAIYLQYYARESTDFQGRTRPET